MKPSLKNLPLVLWAFFLATGLTAAQPYLRLTADKTTAAPGETITVECAVADAPAFACWGATILLPAAGFELAAQAPGSIATYVKDSRGKILSGPRFGGYGFKNQAAGSHVMGKVILKAIAPGTYVLRAPSYSATQPFGGILLPAQSAERVIPREAELTLTITGGDSTPPGIVLKRVVLSGTASKEAVSVQVGGTEALDPKTGRWLAEVEVGAEKKTVEARARDAQGATSIRWIEIAP